MIRDRDERLSYSVDIWLVGEVGATREVVSDGEDGPGHPE